jgi:ribosomal protein L32E
MARTSKKTKFDGITFDSETECDFYKLLKVKKRKGEIKSFTHEPKYELLEGGWKNNRGDAQESIDYFPDFLIEFKNGEVILVDVKGGDIHEEASKLKKKMLEYQNRNLTLYFVSKSPNFLGAEWIETTPHRNMLQKLRNAYAKEHPTVKRKTKSSPQFTRKCWDKYMKVEDVHGLFYTFEKVYTKKEREKMLT